MSRAVPKAVFLDVGWTIAYPRRSIWEIFADVGRSAGAEVSAVLAEQSVYQLLLGMRPRAVADFEGGASYSDSDEEFAAQFAALSRLIFAAAAVAGDPEALAARFLEQFWHGDNWEVFPDVLEAVTSLRRAGVRVGVLSNAGSELPSFLERLGLLPHFDFTVVSALEGTKKPDQRIFARALGLAGVEPQDAVHVGDMYLEDILGARTAGVRALLMERGPRSMFPSFPESAVQPAGEVEVVRDMGEVLAALGMP